MGGWQFKGWVHHFVYEVAKDKKMKETETENEKVKFATWEEKSQFPPLKRTQLMGFLATL